jgi:hypothetical protein
MLIEERKRQVGSSYPIELIFTRFVSAIPSPIPASEDVVNYEVAFPEISPMLFLFANLMFMLPLEAEASKKHIFLPTLAIEASSKKWFGYYKVIISM